MSLELTLIGGFMADGSGVIDGAEMSENYIAEGAAIFAAVLVAVSVLIGVAVRCFYKHPHYYSLLSSSGLEENLYTRGGGCSGDEEHRIGSDGGQSTSVTVSISGDKEQPLIQVCQNKLSDQLSNSNGIAN